MKFTHRLSLGLTGQNPGGLLQHKRGEGGQCLCENKLLGHTPNSYFTNSHYDRPIKTA